MPTVEEAELYLRAAAIGEGLGRHFLTAVETWRDDHLIPAAQTCRAAGIATSGIGEVLATMLRAMADQLEQDLAGLIPPASPPPTA